jgi:biopolymer transport protein ExbB/TolQ
MDLLNLALFSTASVLIFVLAYFLIRSNIQKRKILSFYIQSEMHKHMLGQRIEELQKELSTKELSETDGFVKFISQSRDWAFQYIEEVQKALTEFDEVVDPLLKWAMRFGILNGETAHTKILREISEAYDKLKSVLPENTETPNN